MLILILITGNESPHLGVTIVTLLTTVGTCWHLLALVMLNDELITLCNSNYIILTVFDYNG